MRKIFLHGSLKEKFGESFEFSVQTPREAVRALISQVKGFKEALVEGEFVLILGNKKTGYNLGIEEVDIGFGTKKEFHMIPHIRGSGGRTGGVIKTVIGVALIAVAVAGAVFTGGASLGLIGPATAQFGALGVTTTGLALFGHVASWGAIGSIGLLLAAGGMASLLTPKPDLSAGQYEDRELADQKPSFLFNGPSNQSTQGLPVPIVYGRMRTGSVVISSGVSTEKIG